MLNENGIYTKLTLDQARTLVLQEAAAAGVDVQAGSLEDQLKELLARNWADIDSAQYASIVRQFYPSGSDIDLQNPGFPRLQPSAAKGFLKIDNTAGSGNVDVPLGFVFTAPNGVTYSGTTPETIAAGEIGFVPVQSDAEGVSQNLPMDQEFSGLPSPVVTTNPQPITGGLDLESDSNYINRLIFYKSNNTSQQATVAARKELLGFYQDARVYVNSTNNGYAVPVPAPPQGLNAVVLFDSGTEAGPEEIAEAVAILTRRFEFGNLNVYSTDLHPVIQGTTFAGVYPQPYAVTPGQAVDTYVTCVVTVSFPAETLAAEKITLAQAFATGFAQRLIDLFSGAAGNFAFTFIPSGEAGLPASLPVTASLTGPQLAPFVAIEAVRSLISGADSTGDEGGLNLLSCDNLNVEFDPNEYEQVPVLLSIFAPYEGTLATADFKVDALFSDGSSWYDRYIFLDPAKIDITVVEA